MCHPRMTLWGFGAALVLAGLLSGGRAAEPAPVAVSKLPAFTEVQATVKDYFKALPDYQPGEILTRTDVEPLFPRLAKLGWTVADREAILAELPLEGDFLVEQLRTPAGRKFAPKIAAIPEGYDRLERLSRIPYGKATVRDLISAKDGEKLIEYLATTRGGAEMGKMLSKDPRGKKFNQATGKIYTSDQVLVRLKRSYTAASEAAPPTP